MKIRSYAKINLTLEVISKLQNNYHEIKGIFQNINLFDTIEILESKSDSVTTKNIHINEHENLVFIVLQEFKKYFKIHNSFKIEKKKNIPIASGLGGGSSNAAAVIAGLNNFLGLNLTKTELKSFVYKFGSDIPFFIDGGTCLVSGKGEIVENITECINEGIILYTSKLIIKDKTKKVFSYLSDENFTDGSKTAEVKNIILSRTKLKNEELFNIFNSLVLNKHPEVKIATKQMNESHANCLLSGAGMSLFALSKNTNNNQIGKYYSLSNKSWEYID